MNIKILDSWLREYLTTKATPKKIAEAMSLTSVSIERIEPYNNDFIYDVEVTTNRPDLMSVVGLAREAAAILPQFGIDAVFTEPKLSVPTGTPKENVPITIKSNKDLINRICAVVMDVTVKSSPEIIKKRLEASDIRSLNNLIDVTNYVMRTVGHPTHVFDYEKLKTQTLIVRESRSKEKITTLDNKTHILPGGDIVADDGLGNIVDLLGVMGLENSVVDENTKKILFFVDNIDPYKIRKSSMALGIRTEAAQLNEKEIDPELAMDALLLGIQLYQEVADGEIASEIIDIYHHKPQEKKISVTENKIHKILGVKLPLEKAERILKDLHFEVRKESESLLVNIPTNRISDISIAEDVIEEIARVYGYHNLPNELPHLNLQEITKIESNPFYWEKRAKEALKYWGFTEVYTYPMVSEQLYEGPTDNAVTLQNPLGEDFIYMRRTLIPSLLRVMKENRQTTAIRIFEIANIYEKAGNNLPIQKLHLAGLLSSKNIDFFQVKGFIEQLCNDFGIHQLTFKPLGNGGLETEVFLKNKKLGEIEILDEHLINFELDFEMLTANATLGKSYTPLSKFPPVVEDLSFIVDQFIPTGDIINLIEKQSPLIVEATLLDKYQNSRTFHILYQDRTKNLTTEDVSDIRKNIIAAMQNAYKAQLK